MMYPKLLANISVVGPKSSNWGMVISCFSMISPVLLLGSTIGFSTQPTTLPDAPGLSTIMVELSVEQSHDIVLVPSGRL
jgi:hypothetical protein